MTDSKRVENLTKYVNELMNNGNGKELYLKYRDDIEVVTPQECFEIFNNLLQAGVGVDDILVHLDKFINAFYKSLSAYQGKCSGKNAFLEHLRKENNALADRLDDIKATLKEKSIRDSKGELLIKIKELTAFKEHYLKKENI